MTAKTMGTPLLTAADEVDLAKRIEAGLYAQHLLDTGAAAHHNPQALAIVARDGRQAFHHFIIANLRLAAWFAHRRRPLDTGLMSIDDVTAEGVLGLIHALQKFDFTRGIKFSTYAGDWIRSYQGRAAIAAAATSLRQADYEIAAAVIRVEDDLVATLHHEPNTTEIAASLGITVAAVERARSMLLPALSLDMPVGDSDSVTLADLLPDRHADDGLPAAVTRRHAVDALLQRLSPRERSVITEVFGLNSHGPKSVAAVAHDRHVTPDRVEALVAAALQKLRGATTGAAA